MYKNLPILVHFNLVERAKQPQICSDLWALFIWQYHRDTIYGADEKGIFFPE